MSPTWGSCVYSVKCSANYNSASLTRDGIQGHKDDAQRSWGSPQIGRIGGRLDTKSGGEYGYLYVIPSRLEVDSLDIVITCTILVCHQIANALFGENLN